MAEAFITDVAPIDAPMAVSWKVPITDRAMTSWEYRRMWAYDQEQRQHTVFFDDRHWLRVLTDSPLPNAPSEPLASVDFEASAETGYYNSALGFIVPTQAQRKFEVVPDDPSGRFEEIVRNERSNAYKLAKRLEFISVDGDLHVLCDQPCFKLVPCWVGTGATRIMSRLAVVDTVTNRTSRSLAPMRVTPLPISMREEALRQCPQTKRILAGEFEWPTVHLPESMSHDGDLLLEADYHVQEFLARTQHVHGTRYAGVDNYFRKNTVEEKLTYLLADERNWGDFAARFGVSTAPLKRAVEALDGMSISLAPTVQPPRPPLS
jgi:hypothetical protein